MPGGGFEPPRRKAYAPQTYVSANSTIPAYTNYYTYVADYRIT